MRSMQSKGSWSWSTCSPRRKLPGSTRATPTMWKGIFEKIQKRQRKHFWKSFFLLKSYMLRSGLDERDAWKVTSGKSWWAHTFLLFLSLMTSFEDFLAFRFRLHVVANWARKIVFAPKLVQAVKEVRWHQSLGNAKDSFISIDSRYFLKVLGTKDLLCWDCDVNIKPPSSQVSTHFTCLSSYPDDFSSDISNLIFSSDISRWLIQFSFSGVLLLAPGQHLLRLVDKNTFNLY